MRQNLLRVQKEIKIKTYYELKVNIQRHKTYKYCNENFILIIQKETFHVLICMKAGKILRNTIVLQRILL